MLPTHEAQIGFWHHHLLQISSLYLPNRLVWKPRPAQSLHVTCHETYTLQRPAATFTRNSLT